MGGSYSPLPGCDVKITESEKDHELAQVIAYGFCKKV